MLESGSAFAKSAINNRTVEVSFVETRGMWGRTNTSVIATGATETHKIGGVKVTFQDRTYELSGRENNYKGAYTKISVGQQSYDVLAHPTGEITGEELVRIFGLSGLAAIIKFSNIQDKPYVDSAKAWQDWYR